jgi:hypothetical protein
MMWRMSAFDPKRTSAPVVPVATSARFGINLVTNAQKVVSSIFPKTWPEDRGQRARIATNRDAVPGLTGKPRLTQIDSPCGHRRKRMMSRCQSQAMVKTTARRGSSTPRMRKASPLAIDAVSQLKFIPKKPVSADHDEGRICKLAGHQRHRRL